MTSRRCWNFLSWLLVRVAIAALLFTPSTAPVRAQQPTATNRLVALAKLWGFVRYHHPFLAYRSDVDWDAALVAAIPKVRQARGVDEYRAAVTDMLATLGDPRTRVEQGATRASADDENAELTFHATDDNILVVTVGNYYALASSQSTLQRIQEAIPRARAIVLDVRTSQPTDAYGFQLLTGTISQIERLVTSSALSTPGERRRVFYGFESPSPFSSGQYRTGFFTRNGRRIEPAQGARDVPIVVLLDKYAALPDAALPLQALGRSLIVFEGDPAEATTGSAQSIDLGEGLIAHVRVSEAIFADGTSAELQPDVVVPASPAKEGDKAKDTALALARGFRPSTVTRLRLPASAETARDRSYSAMEYPSSEYRLLALFRFWSAIEYFYPYKRLLPQPWESVLPEFIPQFEDTRDAVDYARVVARLATRLHDSHAYVAGGAYNSQLLGNGYAPVRVRIVEGLPIVTAFTDPEASAAGVAIGDEVVRVDGEDARARLARYAEIISAATPQSLMDKAAISFMNGPVGSRVTLKLRGAAGVEKDVTLTRKAEDYTTLYHRERTGDVVRILDGAIGYVDLDRLTIPMVDDMFEQLRNTKAIIFDMRGYPNGTVWAIAPRLTSGEQQVALLETPLVGHDAPGLAVEAFHQRIGPTPSGAWLYTGKTVMLVDERTVSQAEHTGLYLLAANGTKFVGSPSAGCDGEITTIALPGSITVGFTGQSVRYPDGRELQRMGLVPDLVARPTVSGIRDGRDEVLEAAVRSLNR